MMHPEFYWSQGQEYFGKISVMSCLQALHILTWMKWNDHIANVIECFNHSPNFGVCFYSRVKAMAINQDYLKVGDVTAPSSLDSLNFWTNK